MSTLHTLVLKIRTPRPDARDTALQDSWGVAACRRCGTILVLGESAGGGLDDLCASCRALPPALSTPLAFPVPGTGFAEAAANADAKPVRLPDAA